MRTTVVALLVAGLLAAWVAPSIARKGERERPAKAAEKKRKPRFTVSKETTYVTGPLDKDGYVDCVTALNERLSKGVTPENNANVLLWQAMGPHPYKATMPAEFFKWLGIPAPPEQGKYFLGVGQYLKEHGKFKSVEQLNKLQDDLERLTTRPWTARQHLHFAAWLRANEKPLALVVAATKRTQYFPPLTPPKTQEGSAGLLSALLSGVQKNRELANALAARAMLRTAEGHHDEAWQDLLACHRLGRLVGRGGILIEGLVGLALDEIASHADLAFLAHAKLEATRIKDCLRDLRQLPPMPLPVTKVDLGERLIFLDSAQLVIRGGVAALEGLSGPRPKAPNPSWKGLLDDVDWDPALQDANRWIDRMAAAMRLGDRSARQRQLQQIQGDLKELRAELVRSRRLANLLHGKGTSASDKGKVLGDTLVTLLLPAVSKVQDAADRVEQVHQNVFIAFALAAYRSDHGRYPEKLGALAPKYLPQVPLDLFSGKALIYRPAENGYLLYSVGVNGKDDQGRSYDDDPPGDDLVVRMPLPKLP
jgi:hypothetical protein